MYEPTLSMYILVMFVLIILTALLVTLKVIHSTVGVSESATASASFQKLSDRISTLFVSIVTSKTVKSGTDSVQLTLMKGEYVIDCYNGKPTFVYVSPKGIAVTYTFPLRPEYTVSAQVINPTTGKTEVTDVNYLVRVNGVYLNNVCELNRSIILYDNSYNHVSDVVISIVRYDPQYVGQNGIFDIEIDFH